MVDYFVGDLVDVHTYIGFELSECVGATIAFVYVLYAMVQHQSVYVSVTKQNTQKKTHRLRRTAGRGSGRSASPSSAGATPSIKGRCFLGAGRV